MRGQSVQTQAFFRNADSCDPFKKWNEGILMCCDALEFLKSLRSGIADIIFLDPPFNLGKKYGTSDQEEDLLAEGEYEKFVRSILRASIDILKPGGALYIYHLPRWALRFGGFLEQELVFRHWIAIAMKDGFARGDYLYPAHYALLYFTKGEPQTFQRPKIPAATCRHCGKYIKDYGGYKKYIEDGINLSDVWEDLSPVRHPSKKNRPSNELPLEIPQRVVQISGKEEGVLVDPFVGSGTSVVAAVSQGMQFLACDRERLCCEVTARRVEEQQGKVSSE